MKQLNPCLILLFMLSVTACQSSFAPYDQNVKTALENVEYGDGISQREAKAIADAYLFLHGKYKGRPTYARVWDDETQWAGRVLVVISLATPVDVDLPPVLIDKRTGEVSWRYGPSVEKIDPDTIRYSEADDT